ncbi:hypothetical protein ACFLT4_02650 [Chloroflexota bacterium]
MDLGSGKVRASYYRFLRFKKDSMVTTVDISIEGNADVIAGLEKSFLF